MNKANIITKQKILQGYGARGALFSQITVN